LILNPAGPAASAAGAPDWQSPPGKLSHGYNGREAIEFHIEGLIEDGKPVPPPTTVGREVKVRVAA